MDQIAFLSCVSACRLSPSLPDFQNFPMHPYIMANTGWFRMAMIPYFSHPSELKMILFLKETYNPNFGLYVFFQFYRGRGIRKPNERFLDESGGCWSRRGPG